MKVMQVMQVSCAPFDSRVRDKCSGRPLIEVNFATVLSWHGHARTQRLSRRPLSRYCVAQDSVRTEKEASARSNAKRGEGRGSG